MLDCSPYGTGTCPIMDVIHTHGEMAIGERYVYESIMGTNVVSTVLEETTIGEKKITIVPQIEGSTCITQYSEAAVDNEDILYNHGSCIHVERVWQ